MNYKCDISQCNAESSGVSGSSLTQHEVSGKVFTWNLGILLSGSIFQYVLPDVTFIIDIQNCLRFQGVKYGVVLVAVLLPEGPIS